MKYKFLVSVLLLGIIGFILSDKQKVVNSAVKYLDYEKRTSGAGEAMDAWSFERTFPNSGIESEKIMEAFVFEKSRSSDRYDVKWESLGPQNIAGRTLCLVFHPNDENIFYAGSASGGLWKTTTKGEGINAWKHVSLGIPALAVASMVIDPDNPDVMYVGTGEVYNGISLAEPGIINRYTRGTYGIGVLKTMDGGETWERSLVFRNKDLVGVSDLAINPANHQEIYAATSNGLYQSLDGGEQWVKIFDKTSIVDIEIDPVNTNIIYITQGNLNTLGDESKVGIFKSVDNGSSFVELLDDGLMKKWSGNAKLSISPFDHNILFASIQNFSESGSQSQGGLFKSVDAGEHWEKINSTNVALWQGWYAHDISLDPNDPNKMIWAGVNTWKSENGGFGFEQVSAYNTWKIGEKIPVEYPEGDDFYVHADIHAIYFHPLAPERIYFATDGGVFMSEDGGNTFETLNGGLQTAQFYSNFANSTTDPYFAVGGAQDNASYIYDGSDSWSRIIGGDGMSAAIDPSNDDIVYASWQRLNINRSDDHGDNFHSIAPPKMQGELTAFVGPFELAPSDPSIIYAGRQRLYKSFDYGEHWEMTSFRMPLDDNMILNIAVSEQNASKVYISTTPNPFSTIQNPQILRSQNGGASWINITKNLPTRIVKDIAVDPYNDEIVHIVMSGFGSGHFATSFDSGESWTMNNTLPDVPTNTVLVDPLNTDHIYIGNDLGVYLSEDRGITWNPYLDSQFDAVMVMHLSLSPANRMLRVATHGRGIYQCEMKYGSESAISNLDNNAQWELYPNPVLSEAILSFEFQIFSSIDLSIYDMNGKLVKKYKSQVIQKDQNQIELEMNDVLRGNYILNISKGSQQTSIPFVKI